MWGTAAYGPNSGKAHRVEGFTEHKDLGALRALPNIKTWVHVLETEMPATVGIMHFFKNAHHPLQRNLELSSLFGFFFFRCTRGTQTSFRLIGSFVWTGYPINFSFQNHFLKFDWIFIDKNLA